MRWMLALGLAFIAVLPGAAKSGCSPGCYPVGDFAPQWSADGTQIAYFRGAGSAFESTLVRINARGQERIEVPNPPSNAFPAAVLYSPDLSLIAYPSQSGPLVVRPFSGSPERAIAPRLTIPVAWSPDGARIAYLANGLDLGIVRTDAAESPTILSGLAGAAAWSPDGRRLALVSRKRLYVLGADGSDLRVLADDVSAGPAWSPGRHPDRVRPRPAAVPWVAARRRGGCGRSRERARAPRDGRDRDGFPDRLVAGRLSHRLRGLPAQSPV